MNTAMTTPRAQGLRALRDEMEDLFGRFWGDPREGWLGGDIGAPLDLAELDNAFEIRLDAPGMEGKDFQIEVEGNVVTIRGERKEEKEEQGKTWRRVERRTGKFARTLTLPCAVIADDVAADYAGGVLTVKLPKAMNARPKRVPVKG